MANIAGKRILLVEDEYFIAADLKRILEGQGVMVIGPAGNVAHGLSLAQEPLDAAILDVNLDGAFTYAIADNLAERNIPFMFLTGYDGWSLPEAYRDVQRATKPFTPGVIRTAMDVLFAPAASA